MSDWRLLFDDPYQGKRVWELDLDDKQTIVRTEFYAASDFFETNRAELIESDGHKFGLGKRVASIPPHIWFRKLAAAQRNGDDAYIRKFLNDPDNRAYRTFKGRV